MPAREGTGDPVSNARPRQRFNHVGLSMPADMLDEAGREEIGDFYREVFGWQPVAEMARDREQMVMMCHGVDQFVFLIAEDEPMKAPRLDHFGLAVDDPRDFDEIIERARTYQQKDARVDIIEVEVDDYDVLKIHNFYIGYLLPLMVEVQRWEFAERDA